MSQHGGQTHTTCCAQQCCDMLRWHVTIVWPGLYVVFLWQDHSDHDASKKPADHCPEWIQISSKERTLGYNNWD